MRLVADLMLLRRERVPEIIPSLPRRVFRNRQKPLTHIVVQEPPYAAIFVPAKPRTGFVILSEAKDLPASLDILAKTGYFHEVVHSSDGVCRMARRPITSAQPHTLVGGSKMVSCEEYRRYVEDPEIEENEEVSCHASHCDSCTKWIEEREPGPWVCPPPAVTQVETRERTADEIGTEQHEGLVQRKSPSIW
jgi:hypothetical protein